MYKEKAKFSLLSCVKGLRVLVTMALLLGLFIPTFAQTSSLRVKGKVIDGNGEPVIGAGIIEQGNSSNGTVSDFNGDFELNVPSSATLTVSCIGYASQDVEVNGKASLTIFLSEDTRLLEESVIVGYGVQKKANLTGAVSTINMADENSRPITNIASAMNGASPGLQIMQSSGQPLSESNSITIRGIGTLNTSSPLILVDGMELSLDAVNPADVESISVLKDAASCAIYGNRGANGVILVTTKQGGDGKVTVNYDFNYSYNKPSKVVHYVGNGVTYMELQNEACENSGETAYFSQSTIDTWAAAQADPNGISASGYPNYVAYPNTEWMDWIYTNKWQQKHTLTVSGKERRSGYNFSLSYTDNPGIIKHTGYSRYQARMNFYSDVTDWLRIGTKTTGSVTDVDVGRSVTTILTEDVLRASPLIYPYYDGKYGTIATTEEDAECNNTLQRLNQTAGYDNRFQLSTNFYATIKFLQHFTYDVNYYYYDYRREKKSYLDGDNLGTYNFTEGYVSSTGTAAADASTSMTNYKTYRNKLNHIVRYEQRFGDHDVSAMAAFEQEKYGYRYTYTDSKGLTDFTVNDLDAASSVYSNSGYGTEWTSQAVFGRVNYSYKDKYLFEADFRYDGSSRFAPDYRWGFFPSFSAGWRITEENFMKSIDWLSNLKLRVSWGKLGNNSVGNYDWQSTYEEANYSIGGALTNGVTVGSIANTAIEWETTTVTNIGFNFGFFEDKLSGDLDVYNKVTDGILYAPDMHAVMGNADAPTQNLAEVTNRGIEIQVNWKDNIGKDFHYSVTGQFSYNKNEVTDYLGELEQYWDEDGEWYTNIGDVSTGSTTRIIEGHMINERYLLNVYKGTGTYYYSDGSVNPNGGPKDGMIRTEADLAWVQAMIDAGYSFQPNGTVSQSGLWYGEYIYADVNGDGIYGSSYDYTFQGTSSNPKYNFGVSMDASWKNFDLSMVWSGSAGFTIYYYTQCQNSSYIRHGYNIASFLVDDHYFYDPDNPEDSRTNITSKNSRLTTSNSANTAATSNLHLQKGDFIKLRNLTFGYTLPQELTKKFYISKLRVYYSGENLLTITGFSGLDPELRSSNTYASVRQHSFGVNVTF